MRIMYIAPVYKPAIGGGVIYLELLAKYLTDIKNSELIILTENHPKSNDIDRHNNANLKVVRLFPFRAGMSKKTLSSYIKYVIQNIQFIKIPFLIKKEKIDIVIIHSSFHNNINIISTPIKIMRMINKDVKIISDVRDPRLSIKNLNDLEIYDVIISCSDNVTSHLAQNTKIINKIHQVKIPIVVDDRFLSQNERTLQKYKLHSKKYIFNGSGLSIEKGIKQIFQVAKLLRIELPYISLVIAGRRRYWDKELEQAAKEGWFIFLDIISHDETIILARNSIIDINLSSVDSMPRHTLEAIAYGAKVLLPTGIPEFESCCSSFIAKDTSNINELTRQVKNIISNIDLPSYDISQHFPNNVFSSYDDIIYNG